MVFEVGVRTFGLQWDKPVTNGSRIDKYQLMSRQCSMDAYHDPVPPVTPCSGARGKKAKAKGQGGKGASQRPSSRQRRGSGEC